MGRLRLGGVARRPRGTCEIDGCARPHSALGLCSRHYQQQQRRPRDVPGVWQLRRDNPTTPENEALTAYLVTLTWDELVAHCDAVLARYAAAASAAPPPAR